MNTRHEILHPLIVLGLFAFAPTFASAATYYIAPSGSNYDPGTQSAPFATPQKAHDIANPGDTIYMRGGTYYLPTQTTLTRDGTSGKRIQLFAFPGEKPIIDGANQPNGGHAAVIKMTSASWWHIKGLELRNGPVDGIFSEGNSSNNIFEQLNIHHMGRLAAGGAQGTGLLLYRNGGNNLILNNDVHDNEDQLSFGGGANGINLVTSGTGNIIRGNRAWCNSDDGFDMWNSSPALIENNWVWDSGRGIDCRATGGTGHGLKLGGKAPNDGGHTLKNNVSWKNKVDGF
ncbi:MAG: right-handed parallel beta-helix repeat-containing protein, partial [Gammaproteobacteria bacterium]